MFGHLLSSYNLSPDNLSRQLFLYVYNQTSQPLRKISQPVQIGPKITFLKTTQPNQTKGEIFGGCKLKIKSGLSI